MTRPIGGTCRYCGKIVRRDDSGGYRDYEDVSKFCDPELMVQAHALVEVPAGIVRRYD